MHLRSVIPGRVLPALALIVALTGCGAEQRPTAGSVRTIGNQSGKTGSVSVSAPGPASSPAAATAATATAAAARGTAVAAPAGAQAGAAPAGTPAVVPSKPDGIYTPTTDRTIYQAISADYQEIVKLTNQVNEGKPLPSAEILDIYENAKVAKSATASRPMRGFAREEARAQDYPEAVQFYGAHTFLDTPVIEAINGTGAAAGYTPAQRRQAIQKGLQRIIYHWSRRYVQQAATTLNPGLVDEAWAIYMGADVDGKYPNSLSSLAVTREGTFRRPGSLDVPLRQALSRAQQAAAGKDQAAYNAAAQDVYSRFHAIFYLSTLHEMRDALESAQKGDATTSAIQLVEALAYYQSIQPTVAQADAAADKTVLAYVTAAPASLTVQQRDAAMAALNRAADALLLKPADLVTAATFAS